MSLVEPEGIGAGTPAVGASADSSQEGLRFLKAGDAGSHQMAAASGSSHWGGLLGPPLVVYAVVRLGELLVLALVPSPLSVAARVTAYDGRWYAAITSRGYPLQVPTGPDGVVTQNPIAFFPAYPLVVRAVAAAGVPIWLAELLVTAVAGAAAVVLICLVAARVGGATVGRRTTTAWVVAPPAFVIGLGYSEALFVAAAAGCLLGLLQQRWLTAGLAGCVATATRPVGVALVAAALAAAIPMLMQRRVRPLVAVLLVPAGGVAYLLWIGARTGRADAWFVTEREGWGLIRISGWR